MKVAILSLPLGGNYGGALQDYALQQLLHGLGHEPTTCVVPFPPGHNADNRQPWEGSPLIPFLRKHVKATARLQCPLDFEQLREYGFEGYVAGSDQIWAPSFRLRSFYSAMFMSFLPRGDQSPKVVYGASFGRAKWSLSRWLLYRWKYAPLVRRFDGVSVREDEGVEYCRRFFGVDAQVVLDPVAMLSGADFERLLSLRRRPESEAGVFAYILDPSPLKSGVCEEMRRRLGVGDVTLIGDCSRKDIEHHTMEQWLEGFMNAAFVVTDSFHGTVLSLLFHKPFAVFCNACRGASRFASLLKPLGLEDHIIDETSCLDDQFYEGIARIPDYERVEAALAPARQASMRFLRNSLEKRGAREASR